MSRKRKGRLHWRAGLACASLAVLVPTIGADARPDREDAVDRADRANRAAERAARDTSRAQERALRDTSKIDERAARDSARFVEERAKILETTANDPARQQEELAKLDADYAKDVAKTQEEAAKVAAELAEELADVQEDYAKDLGDHVAEVEDFGSSSEMRELAGSEEPEFDRRGFPVRHGEIVALNLGEDSLAVMQGKGFKVIARHDLRALDSRVTRLAAPEGMEAARALDEARKADPKATFDFTHYYGSQFSPSGASAGGKATLPRKNGRLTLGMIDTGVVGHSALRGASVEIRDFSKGAKGVPTAHGTAVASILVSEGAANLRVANIFRGGTSAPFTSADVIVDALDWMVASKVPVVNMSLAGPRNAILDALVDRAVARGTLIVAAAGNGGPTAPPAYPAALRQVVAVTAVDGNNRIYRYANHGRYITVAARGVGEPAANSKGGISRFSGTSFATPHVAAWMARCLERGSATGCARSLRERARDLGEPGYDPVYGHGLIE
ncbi:MAG: S8 family serine peptidase [Sphingomonadaceae bacterium]